MRRKDDFHFDFNEDAEPVEELHRLRMALTKHFKTNQEHWDYIRATPSREEIIADLQRKIDLKRAAEAKQAAKEEANAAKKKAAPARSRRAATAKKSPARRKTAKQAVHA